MPIVVPNTSELVLLSYLLSSQDMILRLFTNNVTPDESTAYPGGLVEASASGYLPRTLVGAGWSFSQPGGVTTGQHTEQTFSFGTGVSSYGYYLTDTSGNLLWVERFSGAPFTLPSGGGQLNITPKITLD